MATTAFTNNLRRDLLYKRVDFANDSFRIALYNGSSHDANTAAYTAVNEATGSGYTARGVLLAGVAIAVDTTNNVAYVDWSTNPSWASSTISATDCMIFDDTVTTPDADVACYIGDFGGSRSSNNGTFQILFPAPAFNTAILRIA